MKTTVLRRITKIAVVAFCAVAGCHLIGGTPIYYSDPIHARIIDEETGKPVAGVVVVALWGARDYLFGSSSLVAAREAISDEHGDFTIERMVAPRPFLRGLEAKAPELYLYKPGYRVGFEDNRAALPYDYATLSPWLMHRQSFWSGREIPIARAKTLKERADAVDTIYFNCEFYASEWGLTPKRFPLLWHKLLEWYDLLPLNEREHLGNPPEIAKYYGGFGA